MNNFVGLVTCIVEHVMMKYVSLSDETNLYVFCIGDDSTLYTLLSGTSFTLYTSNVKHVLKNISHFDET